MIFKKLFICLTILGIFVSSAFSKEQSFSDKANQGNSSDQQISEFSLAGYGEKGKKTWDISGKSADIFESTVKLQDLKGNLYGNENVTLTAKEGSFDRTSGTIHVEQDVVVTSSGGARLTTDSLDWDRANSQLSTPDVVNIKKESMTASGRGAKGETGLGKMNLEKEVKVEIEPPAQKDAKEDNDGKVVITCDGPLEVDYAKNIAIFNNNVVVDRSGTQIYCDRMEIYFSKDDSVKPKVEKPASSESMLAGTQIDRMVAKGNVKTVRGENITYSEEAIYYGKEKKIVLSGRPRLIIYSTKDFAPAAQ